MSHLMLIKVRCRSLSWSCCSNLRSSWWNSIYWVNVLQNSLWLWVPTGYIHSIISTIWKCIRWQPLYSSSSSGILLFTAGQWLPSHGRRQSTTKNSGHCCKSSSKQPSMGIMSRENSRGGFPLPSSRFLLSNVLLLDSGLQFYYRHIHAGLLSETAMLPPSCHGGPRTLQCCAFEL